MPTRIWPLLLPGWTLNYEMIFYVVFAVALLLPRHLMIPFTGAVFTTAVGRRIHFRFRQRRWGSSTPSPIIMEFVAGMVIGHLWLHGRLKLPASELALVGHPRRHLALVVVLTPFDDPPEDRLLYGAFRLILIVTARPVAGTCAANPFPTGF